MRRPVSPGIPFVLALVAALAAPPPAWAQRGAEASSIFDPRSGRFTGKLEDAARVPDTIAVGAAKVWSLLPGIYEELGVPLTVVDSANQVLGAIRVTTRHPVGGMRLSMILECGTGNYGPNAERYTVQLTLLSGVHPLDDTHSTVETRVSGSASPNGLSSSVKCGSNGMLEEKVVAMLHERLGK